MPENRQKYESGDSQSVILRMIIDAEDFLSQRDVLYQAGLVVEAPFGETPKGRSISKAEVLGVAAFSLAVGISTFRILNRLYGPK